MTMPQRSGDLRSRFPQGADGVPAADITVLRRRAYGQGLLVIDTRSEAFRRQPFALALLNWYADGMGT